MYHYSTFKGEIGTKEAEGLVCIIPENSSGYDNRMYKAYFTVSEEQTSGKVMGSYAISFIRAVSKLPEIVTRFDGAVVSAAIDAYNALVDREDELALVDSSLIEKLVEKFNKARSEYYVSVAEGKIAKLFGMYNNEYCFNIVKDARESFLGLTADEQAAVFNADVLTEKIAELTAAMGVTPDFSKTYSEHFASEEPPVTDDPSENPSDGDDGNKTLVVILIVVGSVAMLAAAGFVGFVLLKKKKASDSEPTLEASTEADGENIDVAADAIESDEAEESIADSVDDASTEVKED